MAECSQADASLGGPICKGVTFDGTTCNLYQQANSGDLTGDPNRTAAILVSVYPAGSGGSCGGIAKAGRAVPGYFRE